jgi:hypothetical protein
MKIQELLSQSREPLSEVFGGHRFHGGFGQKFFNYSLYSFFANQIRDKARTDAVIGEWLTDWFSDVFRLDNPGFNADAFRKMVDGGGPSRAQPRIQQRHFYFLAHEIAAIDDPHAREFLTDWFSNVFGGVNYDFQPERWEKFCTMPADSGDRARVDRNRERFRTAQQVPPADPVS